MLESKLAGLVQRKIENGEQPQHALDQTELADVAQNFYVKFSHIATPSYLKILSKMDGVDENGVVIYASKRQTIIGNANISIEGVFEANQIWHERIRYQRFTVYGVAEMELFAFDTINSEFLSVDSISLDIIDRFSNEEAFFIHMFDLMLEEF